MEQTHFNTQHYLLNFINQITQGYRSPLSSDSTYKELFAKLYELLNTEEKIVIENVLITGIPFVHINRQTFNQLTVLNQSDFLIPIGKNRYFVSPPFVNDYNQLILNQEYSFLRDVSTNIYKNIGHYALAETHRREYENLTLTECLNQNFDSKELSFICMLHKINLSNHINIAEQCQLIANEVLKDFYMLEKLFELIPSIRILFSLMILEDRNSYLGATEENRSLATFMLFKNSTYEILYLPIDVFNHLKAFFKEKNINPSEILKNSVLNFSSTLMSADKEEELLYSLIDNQLNEDDEKILIEALCNDYLYEDLFSSMNEMENEKFQFYEALLQLYGFLPLNTVKTIHDKYFDRPKNIFEIKREINFFYKDIGDSLTEGYFVKPILEDAYAMLSNIYHDIPYYIPDTLDELICNNSQSSYINQFEIQDSITFFKRHIHIPEEFEKNPKPLIKLLIIEELIIPSIKTLPFESDIKDTVEDWKTQGLFKKASVEKLQKHALNLYRHLRLWTLRGHTISEYYQLRRSIRKKSSQKDKIKVIDIENLKK